MDWSDLAGRFDPRIDGALSEGVVTATTVDDWQTVLDLVARRRWQHEYKEDGVRMPVPPVATIFERGQAAPMLRVRVSSSLEPIFRFYQPTTIDFDVDTRTFNGPKDLDELCGFLADVGRALGKTVTLAHEGRDQIPFLTYQPNIDSVIPV